ncbi:two-component response regulator ARR11 isoform X1 [Corylus avellana]|uniref:two-component response regulator ARR11 isoform X1 n=2 Tax=Corylus avellana TaxID=13451 RepID=UPI00286D36DA|nr:two-component response regulator ARR11 isoform X1 [Corylus avellana]
MSFSAPSMENGFSSPRNESFPAGLRVLVVDDDPTWLKILEKMLKKCSYEVTTCGLAREALKLLRERKDGYDIVISDVNMPDMDGFKLLEHVGLEMDLPVLMMSVDGETSRVMKGVQHGACDYLLKPIRMKELRNIWQHVFRKKIHEIRDIESHDSYDGIQISRNGSELSDDGHMFCGEDLAYVKKRKDFENKHDDIGDHSSTKKHRVVWSVDLHQKFVKAVNQIGFDSKYEVGPKKILDLMNVPWLTRENVASHLQKYRLYLSRLQKENDLKASLGGIKLSDLPSKDPAGSFGLQSSINGNQNDVPNGRYQFSGDNFFAQDVDSKNHEGDLKRVVSETKRTLTADLPDPQDMRTQMSFDHSFGSLDSEVNFAAIPAPYSWSKAPENQFKEEHKPLLQLEDGFSQLPPSGIHNHIQIDDPLQSASSITSGLSMTGREICGPEKIKPLYPQYSSNHMSILSPKESAFDSFPVQSKSQMVKHQSFEPISTAISSMKPQGFNLSCITDFESCQRNLISATDSTFEPFNEDLTVCWLEGDCHSMNFGLPNVEFTDYIDPGFIAEFPIYLCDTLTSDTECPFDPPEYSIVDQGLFLS